MDTPGQEQKSAWQRAIDFGIDVSLLEENLRLTPEERLAQLVAMQRLFDALSAVREESLGDDGCVHPVTDERLRIESRDPDDFAALRATLA